MAEQPWDEKAVFLTALALDTGDRESFLAGACSTDEQRERIRRLLVQHAARTSIPPDTSSATPTDMPGNIGVFRILRVIGEGGMGIVYLAEDTVLGRRVALKVLANHLTGSEAALGRFRDEARSAAALQHPSIVPVYSFGFDAGRHFIASEYVDGPTLASVIAAEAASASRSQSTDVHAWHRRIAACCAAIADALECSHRAGIIHRDVKPSNILIDPSGAARLTDFGVAKHLAPDAPIARSGIIGSCHYMSPEQASTASVRIDQRSDVFSLGVVLYEALAFCRPFDGKTLNDVLRAVASPEPPPGLRTLDRRIPIALQTICHKAIEKSPHHRYQSAAHLAADLRSFLAGDPILAQPATLGRTVRRWMRRHRRGLQWTALLAMTFSTAALGVLVRELKHAGLCRLDVVADLPIAEVTVLPLSVHSEHFDESMQQPGSETTRLLPPGHYRIIVRAPSDVTTETSICLITPGDTTRVSVTLNKSSTLSDAMFLVPGAEYSLGRDDQVRVVRLAAFYIDTSEVSNREFRDFLISNGTPLQPIWQTCPYDARYDELPAVGMTWDEAQAFARWKGKRLPTADEWEAAVRGADSRRTPWLVPPSTLRLASVRERDALEYGGIAAACAAYLAGVTPVAGGVDFATPSGLLHTATNVREFTDTIITNAGFQIVIKGACWLDDPDTLDFTSMRTLPAVTIGSTPTPTRSVKTGFRCAMSVRP